jgi:LysR family hydrogen peroxide-inducible transcriptional activator
MEMHQVRYFLAVADSLNFTRAAEHCRVSQPALTRAIQQLEEELGGLLLRRERKLTHLTDFGRLIEPHLRQMAADAEAAKTTAKRFLNLQQAQIRLGVMCTVGPARFMGFLASFGAANPGCEITVVEGVPAGLSGMLFQGELDLAVMAQPDPFNERLEVLPLYDERFCIAFPIGHRLEQQNRIKISDVAGETYLRRINCEYRDYLADCNSKASRCASAFKASGKTGYK